jgi:hypothetical protein
MSLPGTALASAEGQTVNYHTHRKAGAAIVAERTIGKSPAATKTSLYEAAINNGVDQVTGSRYLRACQLLREIAAWIRRGSVEL